MTTFLLITAVLAALAAVVLCFMSWRWSAAPALAGYLTAWAVACHGSAPWTSPVMWTVTALMALMLNMILPVQVSTSRRGNGYIAGGALTGLVACLLISLPWMVAGAAFGAAIGGIAYSLTPRGRSLSFPSRGFIHYLCAKGLPAVVTVSIAALTVLEAVNAHVIKPC